MGLTAAVDAAVPEAARVVAGLVDRLLNELQSKPTN
jgi:hypothetical protein